MGTQEYYNYVRSEIDPLVPDAVGTILEIGCGGGGTMAWLRATRNVDYAAGVELVPQAGDRARGIFDAVSIGSVDELSLNFPVEQFDVILALDVLEHLPRPDNTLKKLLEKLKPGGLFVASIPNVANFRVSWPLFFRGQWTYTDEGLLDRTHLRFFWRDSAIALFQDAGLAIEQIAATDNYPNLFHPFGWRNQTARWYSRKLLRSLPFPHYMMISQYLIAARRPPTASDADHPAAIGKQ